MRVCHIGTDCSNLAQNMCSTKSEVITAQQEVMLIVRFVWTDWLGEFLMYSTHTWEWLISTSLKWPDNVKQRQMPARGCPFIDKFPGQ